MRRSDVAVVTVVAGLGVVEAAATNVAGMRGLLVLGAVAMTAPLLWRRRHPFAAIVAATAVVAIESAAEPVGHPPQAPFLVLLLAAWSGGTFAEGIAAPASLVAACAAGLAWTSRDVSQGLGSYVFMAFILAAAWVAGRFLRERRLYAAVVEERAALLERERDANARAARAEERARIARELHDVVGHHVTVMVVQAGVERQLPDDRARTIATLEAIEETGKTAMTEMRRVVAALRPGDDAAPAGLADLDRLVESVRAAGLPVDLRVDGGGRDVSSAVDLSAYRIVQEALTNVLRHAQATQAAVTLRFEADALQVEVTDDGRGRVDGSTGSGKGLVGIGERVALLGGDFHAGRRREGGFLVRARLPLAAR